MSAPPDPAAGPDTAPAGGGVTSLLRRATAEQIALVAWFALLGVLVLAVSAVAAPGTTLTGPGAPAAAAARAHFPGWSPLVLLGALIAGGLVAAAPWRRLPPVAKPAPVLLAIAALLPLQLGALPWSPQLSIVVVLPVAWLALHEDDRSVVAGAALAVVLLWLPLLTGARHGVDIISGALVLPGTVAGVSAALLLLNRERRRQQRLIATISLHDTLTGAANRRGWDERLEQALALSRRDNTPLTVMLADIDGLREFNDIYGRASGDALLKKVAEDFGAALREVDLLARFEADDFAMLLPNCTHFGAGKVIKRMVAAAPAGLPVSFASVTWDREEGAADLMNRASVELIMVKRRRRGVAPPAPQAAAPPLAPPPPPPPPPAPPSVPAGHGVARAG